MNKADKENILKEGTMPVQVGKRARNQPTPLLDINGNIYILMNTTVLNYN